MSKQNTSTIKQKAICFLTNQQYISTNKSKNTLQSSSNIQTRSKTKSIYNPLDLRSYQYSQNIRQVSINQFNKNKQIHKISSKIIVGAIFRLEFTAVFQAAAKCKQHFSPFFICFLPIFLGSISSET